MEKDQEGGKSKTKERRSKNIRRSMKRIDKKRRYRSKTKRRRRKRR